MLTIGSLFSGIGGLELGLEMAGLGPTLWQVEQVKFAQCVLRHHWPEARLFDDVCAVGKASLAPVDLICGGFPCQDVSSAGKGAGLAGERSGLWREFARVVGEIRPRWVVVENVASGASRWLDAVVRELEQRGYACLPCPVSARDVGAPHLRERIFIVARRVADAHDEPSAVLEATWRGLSGVTSDADSGELREPQQREPARREVRGVRHQGLAESRDDGGARNAADAAALGRRPHDAHERQPDATRGSNDVADVVSAGRERPIGGGLRRAESPAHSWRSPQSGVVPLVHGLSGGLAGRRRRARIRALGNSVVPQCAEVVGWVIRELLAAEAA